MLFVPKSLLDSSPPHVNPDIQGDSSLPAGKKNKNIPVLQLPDRVQKAPSLPRCARSLQRWGEQPPAGANVAASPVEGRWAEPAPLPSPFCACVFPFHADVQRETRHGVRCLQKQVQLGGVLGCGFTVHLFWSGWVTAESSACIVASSSFPRTKPNMLQGREDSSSW